MIWDDPSAKNRCRYMYYRYKIYASVAAFVTWATVACICFQPEGPNVFRKRRSATFQCGWAAAI